MLLLLRTGQGFCCWLLACVGLLSLLFATVASAEIVWTGSLKSLSSHVEAVPRWQPSDWSVSSQSLRLETQWSQNEFWQVEGALDYRLRWVNPREFNDSEPPQINRRIDLEQSWRYNDHWSGRLAVDRLAVRAQSGSFDLVVGRQAIGFGRIAIFSPLDIIAPFAPDALETAVRPGVDALRAGFHYGLDGQVGALFVAGDQQRHDSWLTTWSDNRSGIDLLAIAGRLRSRSMIGCGLAGNLGTLGLKGELTFYRGQNTDDADGDLRRHFAIGAVEAWYRFDNGITLIAEYLYNGPGAQNPQDYLLVADSAPLREGMTYLLGRHYLMIAPSYQLHPLVTLEGLLIWNLRDRSTLLRPAMTCSLRDNLDLELFWSWPAGADPVQRQAEPWLQPASEFGLRGQAAGLFLRYFF
ncbi:MAG: hypothetical protein C0614_03440 [Desulfuromonas sp.]|nr:MAG: hypothetical protein C0614_03440 [Desulfuromonas sp.]